MQASVRQVPPMPETHIAQVAEEKLADVVCVVSEVRTDSPEPQYRRRVHLSLTAAQNAVRRAQERGLQAHMVLCRLEPVEDR